MSAMLISEMAEESKVLYFNYKDEASIVRKGWFKVKDIGAPCMFCPKCKEAFLLSKAFEVLPKGLVTPMVRHHCGFAEWIQLGGWK